MTPAAASIELCTRLLQVLPADRERALDEWPDLIDVMYPELPAAMGKAAAQATSEITIAVFNYLISVNPDREP